MDTRSKAHSRSFFFRDVFQRVFVFRYLAPFLFKWNPIVCSSFDVYFWKNGIEKLPKLWEKIVDKNSDCVALKEYIIKKLCEKCSTKNWHNLCSLGLWNNNRTLISYTKIVKQVKTTWMAGKWNNAFHANIFIEKLIWLKRKQL